VIAYDLRGHGHAQAAPHPITLERFANDLQALLNALEIEQADIAGLSLGGAIAQQFALTYPRSVRSLALVATMAKAFPAMLERAEAAEREGMEAQIATTLMRWFTPQVIALNGWAIRYARERILRARVEDWSASWRALAQLNTFEHLREITQPVQVISGELDQSTPPALMKEIADRLPRASFDVIAGGPHILSLEKPGELARLLLRND
jgi:3-oxoadipate enol-lactonase